MINNDLKHFMAVIILDRVRILLVIDALYIGGTETHVLGLAKELIKNNIFVAIAAQKNGSLVNSFEELQCPIYHIDFPKTISLSKNHELELVQKIEQIIDFENISHIHIHQTPSGYLAGQAANNKGIATVLTIHGTYYPNHEIEELFKLADAVICVSPPLCNYAKTFNIENPYLVPNGIDLEYYPGNSSSEEIRNDLKIPKDSIVLLYASRIAWAKAHVCSIFLRACKDLKLNLFPNLHVIIVGGGDKLDDIKFLSRKIEETCNDTFIHVVGEQKNLNAFYGAADCIVGTGRVALEAMASEKQIIAIGNHGYFGIVNNDNLEEAWNHYFGDHGSIVPCSRHIVRDDLTKLLTDQEQLKLNGKKSREIIKEKFNIQTVTQEILKIYSETKKDDISK